jgi:hypothetical protein
MLAPDARAVLLDELRPPPGHALDAAVATTFTLDLAAALVPPLAFASFQIRGTPDPVAALEAVRACTDRVDVFCQAGQISVPAQASDLMTFLEPMVHEVRRPRAGRLFHPKIWLLRYRGEDNSTRYRLLCLTRNLTRDHSWDAVLRLDGEQRGGPRAANRPLARLIQYLPTATVQPVAAQRVERLRQLAEDVRRVEWERPTDVNEITFHVYGVPGTRDTADFTGYRHLIVAPFLNDAGLNTVAPPGSRDVTVVSRIEDLERLSPETLHRLRPHIVSPVAGIEASADYDAPDDQQVLSGLHAKIYVAERNRRAHLYLGSANATDAAFGGNVEILVELTGGATRFGVDTFLAPEAPFRGLLEEYAATGGAAPDPEDDAQRALADLVRDLAAVPHTLTVTGPADGGYTLHATTGNPLPLPDGYTATVELLTRPGTAHHVARNQPLDATYPRVPLADITPFLTLHASSPEGLQRGTVIRARLLNDPLGRLDEVLARQVNTPEKFLRFLALLLGLGNPHVLTSLAQAGTGDAARGGIGPGPGIFEMLVRALAEQPSAIADLDRLVQRLSRTEEGRTVLPPGFDAVWPVVTAAHRRLRKARAR